MQVQLGSKSQVLTVRRQYQPVIYPGANSPHNKVQSSS